MSEKDTLLAHLAPRIAGGPENAAVEALAYILNKSESTAAAFNDLVSGAAGLNVERCTVFRTQVTAEDNSRPDLVGFDGGREKRVIGEAKFWAPLRDGQARDYLHQLSPSGPSMLLFVVPESRADRLWIQVKEDVSDTGTWEDLDLKDALRGVKGAECVENDRRLGMVSWQALLDRLLERSRGEPAIQENIRQLKGLADRMDSDEILPFRKEELGPEVPRRVMDLARIVNDALYRGWNDGWISPLGARWSRGADENSSGWYFGIPDTEGAPWFGIYYDLWARGDCEETPLWLQLRGSRRAVLNEVERVLGLQATDDINFPVRLKTGVSYDELLEDVVHQLKLIVDTIEATPDEG